MRKTVLITGGSRGIGRAIALKLSEQAQAYDIAITYNENKEAALEVKSQIEKNGRRAMVLKCDVAFCEEVDRVYDEILNTWGPVDVLINNAGIADKTLFQDMELESFKRIMDVNVTGVFNTIKAVLPAMISKKEGYILNISSMWGLVGASMEVAYSASKGAVNSLTKALAKEVGYSGIIVNAIAPGATMTQMCEDLGAEVLKDLCEEIPAGRLARPDEIANLAIFMISGKCDYIQGQIISPNGGLVI
ncbi:3-oxoacyl-ACP reductase FabG [Peptoniphilus sp. GNH]|nr:oxidoreductase, short chain dehydrogenase/reductase family protein [Clostridiales bacterium KA00134]UHR02378.1 3-oxoacyl-ACP reductase FabG [Peptoniphilus sp. GNH]